MLVGKLALICLAIFSLQDVHCFENWKRYDGYKVYDITFNSRQQMKTFHDLTHEEPDYLVFGQPTVSGVQIGVPPGLIDQFERSLASSHISFSIYMENVQHYLTSEASRLKERFQDPDRHDFDIEDFNTYEDIMAEMENMASRCPSDLGVICETFTIGTSYEGRDIKMLRILKEGTQRQIFWVDSGIHSGEWLPIGSHLKILNLMTANYSIDETVTELIDKYDWYFLPIMNPDGYEFTWSEDRFWRKSRSPNDGSSCNGTDLNRNFDFMWMNAGTSDDPCSNNYGGSGPASEPETQVVQDQVLTLAEDIFGFVTLHSAAWMWLHPWGHVDEDGDCVYAEDDEWMLLISNAAADAAQETYNETIWTRGNTCETIYPASATTMDWAKGGAGIDYTCTPEVRGPFDPAPELIEVSFQEVKNALIAMVQALEDNPKT